jgi:HK97 gp10 family phage protein/SPP1 family predicted phage head-tail adaptor
VKAGTLDRRITIEQYVQTQNSIGDPIPTYSIYKVVSAAVIPSREREYMANKEIAGENTVIFRIRHLTGLQTTMRIVYEGRNYDIIGFKEIGRRDLVGAEELSDVLKSLPKFIGDKIYISAQRKGANVLKNELTQTAPVGLDETPKNRGKGRDYGKLRDNIKVSLRKSDGKVWALSVHIGKAYWGMFYEFGTSRQPARPWFRKAFETKAEAIILTITVDMKNKVEKAASDLSKPYLSKTYRRLARR